MKGRKRKLAGLFCLMLALILCFGTLTAHAEPYQTAITPSIVPAKNALMNKAVRSGHLDNSHPNDVYKFTLDQTMCVTIRKKAEGHNLPGAIYDEKGRFITEFYLTDNEGSDSKSFYLMPGTFALLIGTESPSGVSTDYTFSLEYYRVSETCKETKKSNNDTIDKAGKIILNDYVVGYFCENETIYMEKGYLPVDYYQFQVYGHHEKNMSLTCYHAGTALRMRILDSNHELAYDAMGDPTDSQMIRDFTLYPGTYYLEVESSFYSTGYYSFCIKDMSYEMMYSREAYTTVGGEPSWIFNKLDTLPINSENHWESVNESVAVIDDLDHVHGMGPGHTRVYGYSEAPPTVGKTNYYQYAVDVLVEFTDVRSGYGFKPTYYYDPVYWAVDFGITGGYKDSKGYYSTFRPENDCTRAQIVSFLWRMKGCPEPSKATNFKDVKTTDYFYKAVCWAQEEGITGGYDDNTFRPQNTCSRAQIVTFLWRLNGTPKTSGKSSFTDVTDTKAYYYQAVLWATENGITGGYSDKTFRPQNTCSRAQSVTFLYRYYDKFEPKG